MVSTACEMQNGDVHVEKHSVSGGGGRSDVDELDLALINVLQLDPRAPWSTVGKALSVDPVTVARRWSRLVDEGLAWVTAHASGLQLAAFIEIDCEPGQVRSVATTLSAWPHVMSVDCISGSHDLLVAIGVSSPTALSRLLVDAVGPLAGVRATRTHLATRFFAMGGDWQVRALDADQRAQLGSGLALPSRSPRSLSESERELIRILCADGRTSLTELAEEVGYSVSTVRRRLAALRVNRSVVFRCEVAQPLSGWPVSAWLWASVPTTELESVSRKLIALPETRTCVALTGSSVNLLHSVWVRSVEDVQRIEQQLAERIPTMRILDRSIALGFFKRACRLLDESGRSRGSVPVDVWSDPVAAARTSDRSRLTT